MKTSLLILSVLLLQLIAQAKDKSMDDYPMTVTVSETNYSASSPILRLPVNGCSMFIRYEAAMMVINNGGSCKVGPGTFHARKWGSMIELAWEDQGKVKTVKYRVLMSASAVGK
jgi:hypothetical protein